MKLQLLTTIAPLAGALAMPTQPAATPTPTLTSSLVLANWTLPPISFAAEALEVSVKPTDTTTKSTGKKGKPTDRRAKPTATRPKGKFIPVVTQYPAGTNPDELIEDEEYGAPVPPGYKFVPFITIPVDPHMTQPMTTTVTVKDLQGKKKVMAMTIPVPPQNEDY